MVSVEEVFFFFLLLLIGMHPRWFLRTTLLLPTLHWQSVAANCKGPSYILDMVRPYT